MTAVSLPLPIDERAQEVLDYWFGQVQDSPEYFARSNEFWFGGASDTDAEIAARFEPDVLRATRGQLTRWESDPLSCLALVILLDQFSLNIYRDQPRSFLQSEMAIPIALRAIDRGFDRQITPLQRVFLYLPLGHAENLRLQRLSVALFEQLVASVPPSQRARMDYYRDYAVKHMEVIERFGRFPDRNRIFERNPTTDEAEYLAKGEPPF
jgi:uncharacterized protein (DUF924 family)